MTNFVLSIMLVFGALCMPTVGEASESELADTGHIVAQLASSHHQIALAQEFYVALIMTIDPEWYILWYNEAESPVKINWAKNPAADIGNMVLPNHEAGSSGLYSDRRLGGRIVIPIPITIRLGFELAGSEIPIESEVTYHVCKDICILESTKLRINVKIGDTIADKKWVSEIDLALKRTGTSR